MSQISLKSISGITSITTPAGVDNRFSLHNFDSTERFVLDHSGNLNVSGVTTATNFKTGSTNVHNVGVEAAGINVLGADTPIGAGSTIYNSGAAVFTGVVTATSFVGSGANLTGIDATAIQTGTTKVQTNATSIVNQVSGAGIGTFTSSGLNITGVVTATSFSGNGSNLTGLSGVSVANQADNRLITATGTTDALNGEVNLTWDGSSFKATGSGGVTLRAGSTNAGAAALYLDGDSDGDWSGATFAHITHDTSGHLNIMSRNPAGNANIIFGTNDYNAFRVDENRHIRPESDNARDLGTTSYRWRNLYVNDLQLSNQSKKDEGGNDVDGTWGDYTIQEGESDLFLINNRNGKKYQFMLKEIS